MTARIFLIRRVSLLVDTVGLGTLQVYTDLPGDALALRRSEIFDTGNTSRMRPVIITLSGGPALGRLVQIEIAATGVFRLFGGAMEIRALDGGDWGWKAIPGLPGTLGDWAKQKLPIEGALPDWQRRKLPIRETPELASWVEAPVDA